jgi:ornithine cyclodeaminase/alanine dehydrogenase-like protein (mu-crystallin family)
MSGYIPWYSEEDIHQHLSMVECMDAVRQALESLVSEHSVNPLRNLLRLPNGNGLLGLMPGYDASSNLMGAKITSVFFGNAKKGLNAHQGVVVVFDVESGTPLGCFDAHAITAIRTAAASGVATKLLSREDSRVVCLCGAGTQALSHARAMCAVRNVSEIRLWGRDIDRVKSCAASIEKDLEVRVVPGTGLEAATRGADIICTLTPAIEPYLFESHLAEGVHINAVGACQPPMYELSASSFRNAVVVTDCLESLLAESGEVKAAYKAGTLQSRPEEIAMLGEVSLGLRKGRLSDGSRTIYKSLGVAVQDIAACARILGKAFR